MNIELVDAKEPPVAGPGQKIIEISSTERTEGIKYHSAFLSIMAEHSGQVEAAKFGSIAVEGMAVGLQQFMPLASVIRILEGAITQAKKFGSYVADITAAEVESATATKN